jgi:hypothetical protein
MLFPKTSQAKAAPVIYVKAIELFIMSHLKPKP